MSGAVLLGTGGNPSPTAPPLMASLTAKVGSAWFALVDGATTANTVYTSASRIPAVGDRIAVQKVGNTLVEIALVKAAGVLPGVSQTYTPTAAGGSFGTGATVLGRYSLDGDVVTFEAYVALGTGFNVVGLLISLPINASLLGTAINTNVAAHFLDVGGTPANYRADAALNVASVSVRTLGTNDGQASVTATTPFTWIAGDQIMVAGHYYRA